MLSTYFVVETANMPGDARSLLTRVCATSESAVRLAKFCHFRHGKKWTIRSILYSISVNRTTIFHCASRRAEISSKILQPRGIKTHSRTTAGNFNQICGWPFARKSAFSTVRISGIFWKSVSPLKGSIWGWFSNNVLQNRSNCNVKAFELYVSHSRPNSIAGYSWVEY